MADGVLITGGGGFIGRNLVESLNASIANIATVYGPGDRKMNSGSVIRAVARGEMRLVPTGGTSYITVDDLVTGLRLLREKGAPGERYILCNENLSYLDLAQRIAKALGRAGPTRVLPRVLYLPAVVAGFMLERIPLADRDRVALMSAQLVRESFGYKYYTSAKAERELGWRPKRTLEEAVLEAVDYYVEQGLL